MTIGYNDGGSTTTEFYSINGNPRNYTYPTISVESKQATIDYYNRFEKPPIQSSAGLAKEAPGPPPEPEISEEYLQVIRDFDPFYSPTVNNTLHNNRDGELLAYLFTNETISQIIADELGVSSGPLKKICQSCKICFAIKCLYGGGLANIVCQWCAACTVACLIVEFLFGAL